MNSDSFSAVFIPVDQVPVEVRLNRASYSRDIARLVTGDGAGVTAGTFLSIDSPIKGDPITLSIFGRVPGKDQDMNIANKYGQLIIKRPVFGPVVLIHEQVKFEPGRPLLDYIKDFGLRPFGELFLSTTLDRELESLFDSIFGAGAAQEKKSEMLRKLSTVPGKIQKGMSVANLKPKTGDSGSSSVSQSQVNSAR